MQFDAIALSEAFPKGRKSGYLLLENGNVKFFDDDGHVASIKLNDTHITRGGTGNRFIYFTDKNQSITFYTDDLKILNHKELLWFKDSAQLSGKIKGDFYKQVALFSVLVIAVLIAVFYIVIKSDYLIEKIANLVPRSAEIEMSETLKANALSGKTVIKDSLILAQLNTITSVLVKQVEDTSYHFTFTVIKDDEVNAFALPGGPIVINSGLLEKADNAEEIAGVLAHEISHITRRHHVRGLIGNLGLFMMIRGMVGDITGISTQLINVGTALSSLKYSRNYETEADEYGMRLIQKANINPAGMISFFEKLMKMHEQPSAVDFASTHPNPKNRIAHLQSMHNNQKKYLDLATDMKVLHQQISKY